ncbi:3',5'-cyclic-AMP phosphodiesterase [Vibrio maerlii]|uniref:3',5'-cyclic-AMP phosphodiesterase n=1 Tax=Vibrio maerlii TaxID=2231648 RepID=UPI000E3BCF81|nr:3',5'-cyclic-AMP phosphodiesterase [Vibrio maerlii]
MKVETALSNAQGSIRLLQITDTHLFARTDGALLSVKTQHSFEAVVAEILAQQLEFDAILATGDISQDHTSISYQKFAKGIQPLDKQCFWLPGNHDFKMNMDAVFPSEQISAQPHVLLGEHWQMILLDSQVEGVPHGRLSEEQLELLDNTLAQNPDKHSLVVLHHHSVLVGSKWLDQHTLHDAHEFWDVVNKHDNVKAVVCGHVHQDLNTMHQGVQVIATPSTCVQFKPNSDDFALDEQSPGWRELELYADGRLETKVGRLPGNQFMPDFESDGY